MFRFLWPTTLFGGAAASLGALIHAVLTDGLASLTQFGIGGGLAATIIAVVVRMHAAWKAAGGKFDGITTEAEARSLINSAAAELKLPARYTPVAEAFAPLAADTANRITKSLTETVPGATELIKLISQYEARNKEEQSTDHNAVLWKCVDVLSKAIEGNTEGEDLIAKFRDQLDLKLFPGTPVNRSPN